MTLAKYRDAWCTTYPPHLKDGIVLQCPEIYERLKHYGFSAGSLAGMLVRNFQPNDPELEEATFYTSGMWRNVKAEPYGRIVPKNGRLYVFAFMQVDPKSLPPPEIGEWSVEQYGHHVFGYIPIDELALGEMRKEECADWVREGASANQAL